MVNYSDIYAEVMQEFVSMIVPADQGDAGKGQVNARAGHRIHTTRDSDIGYIGKKPGQTQYHEISVDALQDKSDGTGADFLTDVDLGNGTREIRLAYTPYPTAATPPDLNWVQPTDEMLTKGGPLTLKAEPAPGPDPTPVPNPDGKPSGYPPDAPWPMPALPTEWAVPGTEPYSYDWYAQMSWNVEVIYLNLLYRWTDFMGAANWLKNIREDGMSPGTMVEAIKLEDEYLALHPPTASASA